MNTYLPIKIKSSPIRKLAIIPFEKNPDVIYCGLELQYFDGEPYGTGYRVIAARNDKYVDVYDDESLHFIKKEQFHVTGNGLHKHVQTRIKNVTFSKVDNCQSISFEFTDIEERVISIRLEENTSTKSISMNLLAPVGVGSKHPNYLPAFFLYEFDFIRRKNTVNSCSIGGKKIQIDTFPFPMGGQSRFYARYSNECEILEFANTDNTVLREVTLNENKTYWENNVEYIFSEANVLQEIVVHFGKKVVRIGFDPSLNFFETGSGFFTIKPREQMGYLQGLFEVKYSTQTEIILIPNSGWIPKPTTFLTQKLFSKNSVFCSWSKKYTYKSIIDWDKQEIVSNWKNGNIKGKHK